MKRFLFVLALAGVFAAGCSEQQEEEQYTTVLAPLGGDDGNRIDVTDEVDQDEERRYVFQVPVGATYVIIELTGSGDADVFAKLNALATQSQYDCGPQLLGSDEICLFIQDLESAELNITVRGFALYSPFMLTLKWQGIGTSP
jgi:hypothetical protein